MATVPPHRRLEAYQPCRCLYTVAASVLAGSTTDCMHLSLPAQSYPMPRLDRIQHRRIDLVRHPQGASSRSGPGPRTKNPAQSLSKFTQYRH
ncbi:hypothetical protein RSAG8_02558, partial [Rhizoctonia solani AG-8 WAC10335]